MGGGGATGGVDLAAVKELLRRRGCVEARPGWWTHPDEAGRRRLCRWRKERLALRAAVRAKRRRAELREAARRP